MPYLKYKGKKYAGGSSVVPVPEADYEANKERYDASDNIYLITDAGGENPTAADVMYGDTTVEAALATLQRKMPKSVATTVTLTNGRATINMKELVAVDIQHVLSVSGFGQDVLPTFYVASGAYSDYRIVVYASNLASNASASARIQIHYIEY